MSRQSRSLSLESDFEMIIPAETIEAYRNTRFVIHDGKNIIALRIDELSIPLFDLYRRFNAQSSVFITAWNPFGEFLSDEVNELANKGLRKYLESEGIEYLEGAGVGVDAEWPPEKSLLAFGVSQDRASELCRHFKQNAVVFVGPDCVPVLLLHPDTEL